MSHRRTFPPPNKGRVRKAGRRGDRLLMLRLKSNPSLFSVVRALVERLTETLGFPAIECRSITRAVDEGLTNIVRHSYGGRFDQPISLFFRIAQRRHETKVQHGLEIILCDRGPAVDFRKLKGRPLEDIRPGGLGLHLIRRAMDTVEFDRQGPSNQLRLVKYLVQTTNAS
jgi:anti-sigma regulatory factor (Ser/Thr protein kinase)